MIIYAFFFAECRESLVPSFRKKTPLSVRGWGLRELRKMSVRFLFNDGFPQHDDKKEISLNMNGHNSAHCEF